MTGPSDEWVVPPFVGVGPREAPPLLVALPPDFAAEAMEAEASFLLNHAANVFGLLGDLVGSGHVDGSDGRLASLGHLCERAFRDMTNKEGEVLEKLGSRIRRVVALHHQDKAEAELTRQRHAAEAARRQEEGGEHDTQA